MNLKLKNKGFQFNKQHQGSPCFFVLQPETCGATRDYYN